MRFDTTGLWWNDHKPPKISKAKLKIQRTPPDPVWLRADYLPHIDECEHWEPDCFTDAELIAAQQAGERLVVDTESNPNYWSAGFRSERSGKCLIFEEFWDESGEHTERVITFDKVKLDWVLRNFTLIDFNGEGYDRFTLSLAVKPGSTSYDMWSLTESIIKYGDQGWIALRNRRAKQVKIDHIDVMELTPLAPSLKKMAGRFGADLMMDLPFAPGMILSWAHTRIVRWYMFNDIANTEIVYRKHYENIKLREEFGPLYKVDLRSKSDAQMAEAIFKAEVYNRTGRHPKAQEYQGGAFKFKMPDWVQFQIENLKWLREAVIDAEFEVGATGYVIEPEAFKKLLVPIGDMEYSFGIGGLHSTEKSVAHSIYGSDWSIRYILRDHDVASYYPWLIIMSGMFPPAIGQIFRDIFIKIYERRLKEKKIDKKGVWALGLKIVLNGTFGKSSDPWSVLYHPPLMIQTTLTGQLALFMLIERAHLVGFQITNANTDGVVIKAPIERESELDILVKDWEKTTGMTLEATDYVATFSRDVNNYVALPKDGKPKRKGTYGLSAVATPVDNENVKKDPSYEIVSDSITAYLANGTDIRTTIAECADINKFICARHMQGGGAFCAPGMEPEYLGKVGRWYWAKDSKAEILTAKKGYLVGTSEGSQAIMRYNGKFPENIDYDRYYRKALEGLVLLGYYELVGEERPNIEIELEEV